MRVHPKRIKILEIEQQQNHSLDFNHVELSILYRTIWTNAINYEVGGV